MFRIDHATADASLPAPEALGTEGYFKKGNPGTGTPATVVTADWANHVQEEIMSVIEDAGLSSDKTDNTLLLQAITTMIASSVSPAATETVAGKAELATQAEALTGTDDARIMTPLKTTKLFSDTGRQSLAMNGYQKLPGGLIIQWGRTDLITYSSTETVTLPVTFPNAILNVSVTREQELSGTTAYAFFGWAQSTSQIKVHNGTNAGSLKGYWIAIGY